MRNWKIRQFVAFSLVPLVCLLVLFWDRIADVVKYSLIVLWVGLAYYTYLRYRIKGLEPDDPIKGDEQATADLLERLRKDGRNDQ